jgi:low temperature requirement protein LtrA
VTSVAHARRSGERPEAAGAVGFIELFFDLVFVFAITQVSHLLLENLTWSGAAETAFVLVAVWWTWITVLWWTDWVGTENAVVRLELVAAMVACMLMAIAIPEAFDDRGLLFAVAYVGVRVPLHVYLFVARRREQRAGLAALWVWSSAAAAFWIGGALVDDGARVAIWSAALLVEVGAPMLRYRTPRLGEFHLSDEQISTHHLIERFQLFIILVLGESIVLTGATAVDEQMTAARIGAIVVAVLVTAALWALYFGGDERRAQRLFAGAEDRHHLVRDAYSYLHLPIVAGLVVVAVANELVIAHPDEQLPSEELLALAAGPILFLLGSAAAVLRVLGTLPRRRLAAAGAVAGVALLGTALPALATWSLALVVLACLLRIDLVRDRARRASDTTPAKSATAVG